MCLYEVNFQVSNSILAYYRQWLTTHAQEMVKFDGFMGAEIFLVTDPEPNLGMTGLCVQYFLTDQASLDRYLVLHAPRMRAEGKKLFGDNFKAERRVLLREQKIDRDS